MVQKDFRNFMYACAQYNNNVRARACMEAEGSFSPYVLVRGIYWQ